MSNNIFEVSDFGPDFVQGHSALTLVSGRVDFVQPDIDLSSMSPEAIFTYAIGYAVLSNCGHPMPEMPIPDGLSPVDDTSNTIQL